MLRGGGRDHGPEKPSSRVSPPYATSASDRLLPDYRFRLLIVRKGSFFSILPAFAVVRQKRILPVVTE
jgi:hypothetical protein